MKLPLEEYLRKGTLLTEKKRENRGACFKRSEDEKKSNGGRKRENEKGTGAGSQRKRDLSERNIVETALVKDS